MIPDPTFFQHYYNYVIWADRRQIDAIRALPEQEYLKDRGFSFGSIHRTLQHELAAQAIWLDRFEGITPVPLFNDPRFKTLVDIEQFWATLHERGGRHMASLTPQRLAKTLHYVNTKGQAFSVPRWEAVFQMCQHALHHRGQINSMTKLAGGDAPSVDYIAWVIERGAK